MAVGADKPACSQLDAAEVAGDYHHDVSEFILLYSFQYGGTCRTSRLAVVVGLLLVPALPQDVGRAAVAGIVVALLHGLDEVTGLFFAVCMAQVGDEL